MLELVMLNLTVPPVLLLFLPAAVVGNYTLPAPPVSEVAAFSLGGSPLPTWVLNGTLYVLQGGEPAVAVYVPKFFNSSGVYRVEVAEGPFVAQAPPGVMVVEAKPQPARVTVNKTGLYLYFDTGATIAYQPFTIQPPPTTPPPQTTPSPPPTTVTTAPITTPSPTTASTTPHTPTAPTITTPLTTTTPSSTPTAAPIEWLLAVVLVIVIVVMVAIVRSRKR